ncbi:hypothetical protein DFH08DRAFT_944472 [Mycena albidolilacea]|uniref:DUF6589 domain-containing protein n=1 Tax=Mycena albidolilacea TaxID=1033008 RepID=A0AAD6Z503_9AGAR|nr:hypothetical protein DFH08DRAFT_944472 [Mycena albidolilacea]
MSAGEFVISFDTDTPQQHRFRRDKARVDGPPPGAAGSQMIEFHLESSSLVPIQPETPVQYQNKARNIPLYHFTPPLSGAASGHNSYWPPGVDITPEDQVLVVLRAIQRAGFPTLGAFLAALFRDEYNKHPTVYHTIAAFLQAKEKRPENHPIAIIELIFGHRKSQEYIDGVPLEVNFDLPRYALPPSTRLTAMVPSNPVNTTRNAMINWALQRMISRFEAETRELLLPVHGFLRRPGDPALTWDMLLLWNMLRNQETISLHATAIFTLFTTIAVNRTARARVDAAAFQLANHDDEDIDEEIPDDPLPFAPQPDGQVPVSPHPESHPVVPADEPDGEDEPDEVEEPTDEPKTFLDPIGRRDPWQAVTVSILALLVFRNRFAVFFPILIGVFLFTCNAHRDVIALLSMFSGQIRPPNYGSLEPSIQDTGPQFLLLFDNVNKMKRAWRASLGHKDEVKSGTAAAAIRLFGVRAGAFLSEPLRKAVLEKERRNLTVKQLYDDIDWAHIRGIGKGTILRIWLKHIPGIAHHRAAAENLFSSKYRKHVLHLRKSDILTARPTNIDESTTAGAASVLLNLVLGQLCVMPTTLYRWLVMICGDQLSIDRVRKIKRYSRKGEDPFERYEWALPIIQIWHLKWNWQKCIFRLHWFRDLGTGIFGLHHDCQLIERGKFNHEKCDFYPAHHILEDRFEAVVLDALRLLCEEETGLENAPDIKLLNTIQPYFSPGGHLHNCSFEKLEQFAELVYKRYMSNGAAEMARGHKERPVDVYGPGWKADTEPDSEDEEPLPAPSAATKTTEAPPPKKKKKSRAKASAAPARNFLGAGDQCLRFSFWGAGSTNYGNELLELACNFLYEWSDDLRLSVLENYLVNPTGRIGHWLELDLLQEHSNFWIKALFNSKSHDFDSKHLSEAVGLNISGISSLREHFPGLFGLKKNGQKHRDAKVNDDINRLGAHFRAEHILVFESGRNQAYISGCQRIQPGDVRLEEGHPQNLSRPDAGR